jgi:hypothetical protein
VAIRPTDIQGSIWQASQTAPLTQRAEEAPRTAQAAAQNAFAADAEKRSETVDETRKGQGNRIDANAERRRGDEDEPRERKRRGGLEEVVDDGRDEPPHLIDVTA